MAWEIQHNMLSGWENTWAIDGKPETFPTKKAAEEALEQFFIDVEQAITDGDMEGGYDRSEFRVVKVQP